MRRLALLLPALLIACSAPAERTKPVTNPVVYFEIPVTDIDRASAFYEAVLGYSLTRQTIDGYAMALFPAVDGAGASGALAQGDVYVPAKTGPIVYFGVDDIDAVQARAVAQGGKLLLKKQPVGDALFVGEIEDSEGNRIGLSEAASLERP
jgi:predicted enzyme related to lactoylglutathione lyase